MKKVYFMLWVLFNILTFVGAAYVLINHGRPSAGYACVPLVFALLFASLLNSNGGRKK